MFPTAPVLAGGLVRYTSCLQCPCLGDGELQGRETPGPVLAASPRTKGEQKGRYLGGMCSSLFLQAAWLGQGLAAEGLG